MINTGFFFLKSGLVNQTQITLISQAMSTFKLLIYKLKINNKNIF